MLLLVGARIMLLVALCASISLIGLYVVIGVVDLSFTFLLWIILRLMMHNLNIKERKLNENRFTRAAPIEIGNDAVANSETDKFI